MAVKINRRSRPEQSPFGSAGKVGRASITVGAEAGNAINVQIQMQNPNGIDCAQRVAVPWYLSNDANGDSIITTAPSGGVAIGTDGVLLEWTDNKAGLMISEADGDVDITLTEAGVLTCYLILVMPDGSLVASGAITFA